MSSNAENKMYTTIRMRKTKKRVTAATKLQALVRGKLARRAATVVVSILQHQCNVAVPEP